MKIVNIKNLRCNYRTIYDYNFWDNFIGNGEFDINFLKNVFDYKNKNYLLLLDNNNIVGIFVYQKIPNTKIYKILLIAKEKNTTKKKIGAKFIKYIEKKINNSTLVLIDDSEIPNYYENLGFIKTTEFIYNLLVSNKNKNYYYKNI